MLAWLRLLVDPGDAGAVVRALARPPIELRSVDLARCVQIARRRKLDMVAALVAATESPQLPPEARERILALPQAAPRRRPPRWTRPGPTSSSTGSSTASGCAASSSSPPRPTSSSALVRLAQLGELAAPTSRRAPAGHRARVRPPMTAVAEAGLHDEEEARAGDAAATAPCAVLAMHAAQGREFRHVFVIGLQSARMPGARRQLNEPSPTRCCTSRCRGDTREAHVADDAPAAQRGDDARARGPRAGLRRALRARRAAAAVAVPGGGARRDGRRVGGARARSSSAPTRRCTRRSARCATSCCARLRATGGLLGELRLDTDLDIAHGTVRYLELVKLAALMARPDGQPLADALPQINARAAAGGHRRSSATCSRPARSTTCCSAPSPTRRPARARWPPARSRRWRRSCPRRGDGLLLSAGDIETYRTCPLKYKFARVFRIPSEPTLNQRFGILVHQVLERYHQSAGQTLDELLGLLDAGWRRGGFGTSDEERQLQSQGRRGAAALLRPPARGAGEPVWFEKAFTFRMGRTRCAAAWTASTGCPTATTSSSTTRPAGREAAAQLREDVQLSLYAVGAREAWGVRGVTPGLPLRPRRRQGPGAQRRDRPRLDRRDRQRGRGRHPGQGFEPTPSYAACSMCDYRIACPAAER